MDRKQSIITKDKAARNMVFLIYINMTVITELILIRSQMMRCFFDGYESRLNEKSHKFAGC